MDQDSIFTHEDLQKSLKKHLQDICTQKEIDALETEIIGLANRKKGGFENEKGWRNDYTVYRRKIDEECSKFINDDNNISWIKYTYPYINILKTLINIKIHYLIRRDKWSIYTKRNFIEWNDIIRYSFTYPQLQVVDDTNFINSLEAIETFKQECLLFHKDTNICNFNCNSKHCSFLKSYGTKVYKKQFEKKKIW